MKPELKQILDENAKLILNDENANHDMVVKAHIGNSADEYLNWLDNDSKLLICNTWYDKLHVDKSHFPNKKKIYNRLEYLQECVIEDDDDYCRSISEKSLINFLRFMKKFKLPLYPGLTLTPGGNIYTTFKLKHYRNIKRTNSFHFEFCDDIIKYVIINKDRKLKRSDYGETKDYSRLLERIFKSFKIRWNLV